MATPDDNLIKKRESKLLTDTHFNYDGYARLCHHISISIERRVNFIRNRTNERDAESATFLSLSLFLYAVFVIRFNYCDDCECELWMERVSGSNECETIRSKRIKWFHAKSALCRQRLRRQRARRMQNEPRPSQQWQKKDFRSPNDFVASESTRQFYLSCRAFIFFSFVSFSASQSFPSINCLSAVGCNLADWLNDWFRVWLCRISLIPLLFVESWNWCSLACRAT